MGEHKQHDSKGILGTGWILQVINQVLGTALVVSQLPQKIQNLLFESGLLTVPCPFPVCRYSVCYVTRCEKHGYEFYLPVMVQEKA